MKIGRKWSGVLEEMLDKNISFGAIVFHSDSSCHFQFGYCSCDNCNFLILVLFLLGSFSQYIFQLLQANNEQVRLLSRDLSDEMNWNEAMD